MISKIDGFPYVLMPYTFFFVLFVCSENCFQGLGDMKSVHLHCWNVAVLCVAGKDAVLFSFLKIF